MADDEQIAALEKRIEQLSLEQAMSVLLAELRGAVPYDSCSVQELRETRLVIVGGVGFAESDVIIGESFDTGNADIPNSEVVYRRRPLLVGDTEQYRAFRRGLHVGAGIRSWLGIPLLHGESLVGMIALDKAEADFYTAEHLREAQSFAKVLAVALSRSRAA